MKVIALSVLFSCANRFSSACSQYTGLSIFLLPVLRVSRYEMVAVGPDEQPRASAQMSASSGSLSTYTSDVTSTVSVAKLLQVLLNAIRQVFVFAYGRLCPSLPMVAKRLKDID